MTKRICVTLRPDDREGYAHLIATLLEHGTVLPPIQTHPTTREGGVPCAGTAGRDSSDKGVLYAAALLRSLCVAAEAVDIINRHRKGKKLPSWWAAAA